MSDMEQSCIFWHKGLQELSLVHRRKPQRHSPVDWDDGRGVQGFAGEGDIA